MSMQSYVDGGYRTFEEQTAGELTGKEHHVVKLGANENAVELAGAADIGIGVMHAKLQGSSDVTIRMLGKGGTVKVVQGGVIAKGALVKEAAGGQVVAAVATNRAIGRKLTQGNGAAGDVIEIIDNIEVA